MHCTIEFFINNRYRRHLRVIHFLFHFPWPGFNKLLKAESVDANAICYAVKFGGRKKKSKINQNYLQPQNGFISLVKMTCNFNLWQMVFNSRFSSPKYRWQNKKLSWVLCKLLIAPIKTHSMHNKSEEMFKVVLLEPRKTKIYDCY